MYIAPLNAEHEHTPDIECAHLDLNKSYTHCLVTIVCSKNKTGGNITTGYFHRVGEG